MQSDDRAAGSICCCAANVPGLADPFHFHPVLADDLRRIAPTHLESINLRGTFNFPIERYAHHLLPGVADLHAKQRRLA
jgi:hypothetical protein